MLRIKRFKISGYGISAAALIVLAIVLRLVLIALGWPQHNSDESVMGLMALHISYNGERPIFFYGQNYMGATEAYLAAGIFRLFGASVFTLRLVPLLFFALFLVSMYQLTCLLYSKQLALVTLILLGLGSNIVLQTELVALGGYPEMLGLGALLFLLAGWLALSNDHFVSGHFRWRFSLGYALWGLVAGVGVWSDYIFVVFVLMSGLLLLAFCWRTLLSPRVLPFLLLGLLMGIFPLIIYNTSHPLLNSWEVLQGLRDNYAGDLLLPHRFGGYPYVSGIVSTLLVSLPSITGAPSLCYDHALILNGFTTITPFQCLNTHYPLWQVLLTLIWSVGLLVLWALAVLQTLASLYRLAGRFRHETRSAEQRQAVIRHFARLALLVSAAFFLAQFALSPVAAVFPTNARYLTGLLVSTPAVIAPLWGISREIETPGIAVENGSIWRSMRFPRLDFTGLKLIAGRAILLLVGLVLLWGSVSIFGDIPAVQANRQQENALIRDLLHINVRHIYTGYWTCYRLAFDSNQAITCITLNPTLIRSHDRYPGYDAGVKADPHAAYVFPIGDVRVAATEKMAAATGKHFRQFNLDGYVIFQPE